MNGIQNVNQKINKSNLLFELKEYSLINEKEKFIPKFIKLLQSDRCFYRDHFDPGHITASALLINKNGDQVLMNHHKSLNRWLAFGGHCDGDEDTLNVAIRETMEESGLTAFRPISSNIVDIDIHTIPANPKRNEPEHDHYDISYIMQMTGDQKPIISDESINLKWMTFDEAIAAADNKNNMTRLITKARNLLA